MSTAMIADHGHPRLGRRLWARQYDSNRHGHADQHRAQARGLHECGPAPVEPQAKQGGEEGFEGVQRFLTVAHTLANERRLSRFMYLALRPR